MVMHRYNDTARDQETLAAVRGKRAAMEAIEKAFFQERSVAWVDVEKARDEYLVVWEERRNFVLSDKAGMTRQELAEAIGEPKPV
jgi:acetyl-CoA acetyltransferase